MNLSVYRRQYFVALNNYIADVVEEIIPGRLLPTFHQWAANSMNKWAANPDPTGNLFLLFFAKTVSHNNYLYQITKPKLKI